MLLGVLTGSLVALAVLSLILFNRELANPSFVYLVGFLLSSICALLFAHSWQFTLHFKAFFVILTGSVCFIGVCYLCKRLIRMRKGAADKDKSKLLNKNNQMRQASFLPIYSPLIVAYIILGVIVLIWTLVAISQLYPAESLAASIAARKYSATFTTDDGSFYFPLNQLRSLYSVAGYVVTFLIAQEFARRRLLRCPLLLLSYIILVAYMLTNGARTDLANNIIVLVICYLLIVSRGGEQTMRRLSSRTFIVLVALVLIFIFGYQFLAIGRSSNGYSLDNLGAYLGAEISNLDTFLETSGQHNTGIFGYMTFIRTINYLGGLLGIDSWVYPLDLPYLSSNGHWMGNVYGTYYAFIYDFGYVGVPILTAIMALISETVYEGARRGNRSTFINTLLDLMYGYIACNLLFCFFSNRFYENVISINIVRFFVYLVISLILYSYLPKSIEAVREKLPAKRSDND